MKYKILILAIALSTAVLGYALGRFETGKAWNSFAEDLLYRREALEAQHSVRLLTYLRQQEQTNALSTLETFLDGQLGTLASYQAVRPGERREEVVRAIRVARNYRQTYPWQSASPEAGKAVREAFSLAR